MLGIMANSFNTKREKNQGFLKYFYLIIFAKMFDFRETITDNIYILRKSGNQKTSSLIG